MVPYTHMRQFRTQTKKDMSQNSRGLTIVEFIIYFAITLVMLGIIVQISLNVLQGKEKIKAYQEVGRSGRNAIDAITDAVASSTEVLGTSNE